MKKIEIDDFVVWKGGSGFVNSIDKDFVEVYLFPKEVRDRHGDDAWAIPSIDQIEEIYRTGYQPDQWKNIPTEYIQLSIRKVRNLNLI